MKKKLIALLFLSAFTMSTAQGGILLVAAGATSINFIKGNSWERNTPLAAFGVLGLATGAASIISGLIDSNSSLIVLNHDSVNGAELEKKLEDNFPFIDDSYVLRGLANMILEKHEAGEAVAISESLLEVILEEEEVKRGLESSNLSPAEIKKISKFLCETAL